MEIISIFEGESLTINIVISEPYDMARLKSHQLYIGARAVTGDVIGNTILAQLPSEYTHLLLGLQPVTLWIDDLLLGVRKTYVGDMLVRQTNAREHNASTSEVHDVVIPVTVNVTTITVDEILFNYMKGDPFLYDDFTHEQIAELQRPATDAATAVNEAEALRATAETTRVQNEQGRVTAEGTRQSNEQSREDAEDDRVEAEALRVTAEATRVQNEQGRVTAEGTRQQNETTREDAEDDRAEAEALRLSAETTRGQNEQGRINAEGLRVTAEQTRQTNTATAITNANNAATNANTKAGLADTAANNANAKAGLADTAATNANTKAGLADTAATNADNARLAIQGDLALKENTSNKQNSLATDGTGTKFPTVDAVNAGLAGASNLLYQYIHSGNKEVYISAIDYVTHTFTSVGHGLANGDQLNIKIIGEGIIEQIIPFSDNPTATNQIAYYVINSTLDTFQISLTNGGAAILTINKATQNFSLWRFEKTTATNIQLLNLPSIGCDIEMLGDLGQIQRQIYINGDFLTPKGYVQNMTTYQTATQVVAARYMYLRGRCNINVRRYGNITYINRKTVGINLEPTDSTKIKWVASDVLTINTYPVEALTSIRLSDVRITNGTILNVYKI